MKQETKGNMRVRLLIALAAVVLIVAVVILATRGSRKNAAQEMSSAVARLQQMEAGDPDAVVQVIRQQQKERMAAQREQMRDRLLSGEVDVWSQFQDYVLLGDSRASGFKYYNWLPSENVLAEPGDTIWVLEEHLDDIKAMKPARVYLGYGGNDVGYWNTAEEFTAEYARILAALEEAVPGVEIYVSSILEVQSWAATGAMQRIPSFNAALKLMCGEHGYTYVDCTQLTAEHQELYEVDGVHFVGKFYQYWGTNFILATYYRGAEEDAA